MCVCVYIYIYIYYVISCLVIMSFYFFSGLYRYARLMYFIYVLCLISAAFSFVSTDQAAEDDDPAPRPLVIRPVHLLRVFLLRILESNFPGDPL